MKKMYHKPAGPRIEDVTWDSQNNNQLYFQWAQMGFSECHTVCVCLSVFLSVYVHLCLSVCVFVCLYMCKWVFKKNVHTLVFKEHFIEL